ncbi:MAG TPA: class I SAM-dependent methyltransferase [Casimicrobiaceae bacterium]|nr:class I SAM-dependent methyltransferase [Casimicrobiaceae bacterium]
MIAYYGDDLAWVHHAGYSQHVERTWRGIVRLLRDAGLRRGARVLDAGCGSGLLARRLLDAGFAVTGIDASPAMIDLARSCAPGADFRVASLPTGSRGAAALPHFDAVVSTGHVLNYLGHRSAIARALAELARALKPSGVLAIDLMTERFARIREGDAVHAKVEDDWAIVTRFSRPGPHRFDRDITVFRRSDGDWRRSDEHHRNVTFEVADALRILRDSGIDARRRAAFGEEALPAGLVVLTGVRRSPAQIAVRRSARSAPRGRSPRRTPRAPRPARCERSRGRG